MDAACRRVHAAARGRVPAVLARIRETPLDETHDPALRSWVESANADDTDFPIQNLPYGVFRRRSAGEPRRIGVAIGRLIADLARCEENGLLDDLSYAVREACHQPALNALAALGPAEGGRLRERLATILAVGSASADERLLVPMDEAELFLPVAIGDYTDFYASIHHAARVGRMLRPDNPLPPNYKHIPLAYHGRSSSIVISGTPVHRPAGQIKGQDGQPAFRISERLDYEAEVGFLIGRGNDLGHPIALEWADDHVFGLCLLNDWSARDLQAWESQPLGPFLSKNFATTVSPWVVTLEALAPFRCAAAPRVVDDPPPLAYLLSPSNQEHGGIDITVDVLLRSAGMRRAGMEPLRIGRGSLRDTYWTVGQMVTHHTSGGCNLRPGDLLGSGTISGPDEGSEGCLLEKTRLGAAPIALPTGETRVFLADGDEVILRARAARSGYRAIGFGECTGIVGGTARA